MTFPWMRLLTGPSPSILMHDPSPNSTTYGWPFLFVILLIYSKSSASGRMLCVAPLSATSSWCVVVSRSEAVIRAFARTRRQRLGWNDTCLGEDVSWVLSDVDVRRMLSG